MPFEWWKNSRFKDIRRGLEVTGDYTNKLGGLGLLFRTMLRQKQEFSS